MVPLDDASPPQTQSTRFGRWRGPLPPLEDLDILSLENMKPYQLPQAPPNSPTEPSQATRNTVPTIRQGIRQASDCVVTTVRLGSISPGSSNSISDSSTLVALPSVPVSPNSKHVYLRPSEKHFTFSQHRVSQTSIFAGTRPFGYEPMDTARDPRLGDGDTVLGDSERIVGREREVGGKVRIVGKKGGGQVGVIGDGRLRRGENL